MMSIRNAATAVRWVGRDVRDGHVAFEVERDRRHPKRWTLWRSSGLSQTPGGDGVYQTGRYTSAAHAMDHGNQLMGNTTILWEKL